MSDDPRIVSRLNKALALFVSVPLTAMPVAAQDRAPGARTGARTGLRTGLAVGVRAIRSDTAVRVPANPRVDKRLGKRLDIRVPERVGERVPAFGSIKGQ